MCIPPTADIPSCEGLRTLSERSAEVTNSEAQVHEHCRTIQTSDVYGGFSQALGQHWFLPEGERQVLLLQESKQLLKLQNWAGDCCSCQQGQRWLLLGVAITLSHPSEPFPPLAAVASDTWHQGRWHRQEAQTSWCMHTSAVHWALYFSGKHAQGCTHWQKAVRRSFRTMCLSESKTESSESHWVMVQEPALSQECSCCAWAGHAGELVIPSPRHPQSYGTVVIQLHLLLSTSVSLHSTTCCCADTASCLRGVMVVTRVHQRTTTLDTISLWKI